MSTKTKIEKLRNKLHESIKKHGVSSEQATNISIQIDELINRYNREQRMFDKDNNINLAYKQSLNKLKQIVEEFGEFPTVSSWNYYAKKNALLNSESIKFISHVSWHELREEILHKINKKNF